MDHNEIAAPRVDNIPLEGTERGWFRFRTPLLIQ